MTRIKSSEINSVRLIKSFELEGFKKYRYDVYGKGNNKYEIGEVLELPQRFHLPGKAIVVNSWPHLFGNPPSEGVWYAEIEVSLVEDETRITISPQETYVNNILGQTVIKYLCPKCNSEELTVNQIASCSNCETKVFIQ